MRPNQSNTYKRRQWTQGYPTPRIMFQCNEYVYEDLGKRCSSKSISEDAIYAAICEVVKKVFLNEGKITASIQKLIEKHLDLTGVQSKLTSLNIC